MIMQEKKVSHLLHLILTLISCGMWSPMWVLICLSVSLENRGIRNKNKKFYEQEKQEQYEMLQRINSGRYVK